MHTYTMPSVILTWRRTIMLFLLICCVVSGCTYGNSGTGPAATTTPGPIQLYDIHGKLICQLHGQNPQNDCLAQNAQPHQLASQFIAYALNELASDLHVSSANLPSYALNVSTTLDLNLQTQVLQKAQQYIATMAVTHNMTNAGIVMLDYHTGAIRSLIGSLDSATTNGALNVVTQKTRMVGSVFKPFVYATAFEQGISPGEVVYDGPFSVGTPPYSPKNYDQKYHGFMSYRSALQNDFNIPALKLLTKTGFIALKQQMSALGLNTSGIAEGQYSVAFGAIELPLLDATVAYGAMANGGVRVPPHAIENISIPHGQTLYTAQPHGIRALSPATAFMLTDVMSDNNARAFEFGQCSPMELYTTTEAQCKAGNPSSIRPSAVHSGVDDNFRDTMTVGYTSDLVAGTWTGNSDASPMFNVTARNGAAQIWHDSMLLAEAQQPITPFPGPPAGVVQKTVNYPNLTTTDWYHA